MSKANKQKIIAIVVILLVLIIIAVVFLATRNTNKGTPQAEIAESTEAVTESDTAAEETDFDYDYDMKLDMNKVKEAHDKNPDVKGWVYIDGTNVDYPVVQGKDNDEYMYKDWETGNSNHEGSIFDDYRSEILECENTLIYGHNMKDGSMFANIKKYKDEDWGKDHLYVELATLDKRYLCEVFSVNVINGLQGADFEYWNYIDMDPTRFSEFMNKIQTSATVWYGDDGVNAIPEYGDKVLTLQTCENGTDDGMRCDAFAKELCEK